jgi:hypothetical protein
MTRYFSQVILEDAGGTLEPVGGAEDVQAEPVPEEA